MLVAVEGTDLGKTLDNNDDTFPKTDITVKC